MMMMKIIIIIMIVIIIIVIIIIIIIMMIIITNITNTNNNKWILNNDNDNNNEQCIHFKSADISYGLPESTHISRRRLISRYKLLEIRIFLYYKNKAREDIFEEKGIREQFC